MVNSVSPNSTYYYNNVNSKASNSNNTDALDAEIKTLQGQKSQIEKQIGEINSGKASQKDKDELTEQLKQQIEQIDSNIQQIQMKKIEKNTNRNTNKKSTSSNNNNSSETKNKDQLILENCNNCNNIQRLNIIMKSSKNSANIITEEAKLDKDRDKLGNAAFIIKKKLNEAASDEGRANSIETIINKETAQINDNIKQTGSKHNHSDVSNKQDTQDNDKTNRKDEMEKSIDTYV